MNEKLENYLDYYCTLDSPQYAVLINGEWGCGKTFFIKNYLSGLKKQKETAESVSLKPIYISLNGVSKITVVTDKIREELSPFIHSKGVKFLKKILIGSLKTATQINFDGDGDGKDDGKVSFTIDPLSLLKKEDPKIKGNKILVFDDLERCKIELTELFGYINEFVEHHSCKVVLIGDESRFNKKESPINSEDEMASQNLSNDGYKEFKEKLIGQTFTFKADVEKAIETFLINVKNNKKLFEDSSPILVDFFHASKINNLRILRQAILDFDRFTLDIDKEIVKHKSYNEFLKNLLGHFVLIYLEYKSGNQNLGDMDLFDFGRNKKSNNLKAKYDGIIDKHGLYHRMSIISYDRVIEFIRHGVSNKESLNASIKENGFFREATKQDWEKLWYWEELDDAEFKEIYTSVKNDFDSSKYRNPYILIHVVMIFISLREEKIISINRKKLVSSYKQQLKEILKGFEDEMFNPPGESAWNRGYRSKESNEFQEIIKYTTKKFLEHNGKNKSDYVKNIFESLDNENLSQLEDNLNKPLPDRRSAYCNHPILENVDPKRLANNILSLSAKNLTIFYSFLQRRYYPEEMYANGFLAPYNKADRNTLQGVKSELELMIDDLPKIKKRNIKMFVGFLSKLVEKLDKL